MTEWHRFVKETVLEYFSTFLTTGVNEISCSIALLESPHTKTKSLNILIANSSNVYYGTYRWHTCVILCSARRVQTARAIAGTRESRSDCRRLCTDRSCSWSSGWQLLALYRLPFRWFEISKLKRSLAGLSSGPRHSNLGLWWIARGRSGARKTVHIHTARARAQVRVV